MEIEPTQPFYTTLTQPKTVYRLNTPNGRLYYTLTDGKPVFYISVTTFIKRSLPTSPHLIKWIAEKGYDESQDYMNERANYGTFMHIIFQELLVQKTYDIASMEQSFIDYCNKEAIPHDPSWLPKFKKDLLAFAQFVIDYQVEPLAIEMVLTHQIGFAGAIDLICYMTIMVDGLDHSNPYKSGERKGQPRETKVPKKVLAIVDHKSGRKGFHESHEVQLAAYKEMVEENFPELKIDKLYNFSPKEWRNTPSYNLKDQTDSTNVKKLKPLMELAKIDEDNINRSSTIIEGVIDLSKGIESNCKYVDLADYIIKKHASVEIEYTEMTEKAYDGSNSKIDFENY